MKKDKRLIILLSLATAFFLSFSVSAFVFIKANGLAFVKDMEEYERKVKIVDQAEEKIAELEEQVARYKKLYENAIKDNKRLSADVVKPQNNIAKEKNETTTSEEKTVIPEEETITPEEKTVTSEEGFADTGTFSPEAFRQANSEE